jgi:diguanylate cyclase (GGDEF)-like protein
VAALALLLSARSANPLTTAAASLTLVLGWYMRPRMALAVGMLVLCGLLARQHARSPRRPILWLATQSMALVGICSLLPTLARRGGPAQTQNESDATTFHGDPPARAPRVDEGIGELDVEAEAVRRFLGDARISLGVDDVLYWRLTPAGELIWQCSASGLCAINGLPCSPPLETLVTWAAAEGQCTHNDDNNAHLIQVVPVDSPEQPMGALVAYVAQRPGRDSNDLSAALLAVGGRFGVLLQMLDEGRHARRFQKRTVGLIDSWQRIQDSQDLAGAGRAICASALTISAGARVACVHWDEDAESGRICGTTDGHPVAVGFEVDGASLVGTACRERQRFVLREDYRRWPGLPVIGPDEPQRALASLAILPLERRGRRLGAIVVEGTAPGQLTVAESRALELLAPVAAAGLEHAIRLETMHGTLKAVRGRLAEASEHALTDSLTCLANRRGFDQRLAQHLQESDRYGQCTSLLLLDLDHFKVVNDRYGHAAGDAVLREVARTVAQRVRGIDVCARYGGEELAVVMPQTPLARAAEAAERLRKAIEDLELSAGDQRFRVTVSIGVASYPESCGTQDELFGVADRELYEAKRSGRNRVKVGGGNAALVTG